MAALGGAAGRPSLTARYLRAEGVPMKTDEPRQVKSSPSPAAPVRLIAFEQRALRRAVLTVLLIVTLWMIALWVFQSISHFLFLLLLSWLFAMAMEPAINWLTGRGWKRGLATALVGSLVVLAVVGLGAMFGNLFFSQLASLVQSLPDAFKLTLDPTTVTSNLNVTPSQVGSVASNLAGGVLGVVTSLLTAVLNAVTFLVFALYLAADGPRVRTTIGSWLPPARQDVFVKVWDIAQAKTGGYVVSKVVLAGLSSVFYAAFFYLVGVPSWLPLAVLVGLMAQFVPVVGTYFGILIPILFVVFSSPITAVWIVVFATIYQQIETYVFTPRVSKRTMDVNAGIALASVFIGAALWGAVGALIGIPMAAAIVAVLDTYGHRHELVPALAAMDEPDEDESDDDESKDAKLDDAEPEDATSDDAKN
jgi:predicted PurR-regulated permease PerM